jgi:protein TonB
MGYQALLFCPDEKMARVVSQVFTELDFTVEPVHEPFAAVKKLMAQRYDAIVVDCDNEQNASLLFKSARNSSSNQNSLAIAVVEGQMGVAKAYRIGANLVLTKPVNVEQAKGTLRVARGLLRKNSEAAASASAGATAARTTPASAASSFRPASPAATAAASQNVPQDIPQFEAPQAAAFPEASPLMRASANAADQAAVAPAAEDNMEIAAHSASAEVRRHASSGAIRNDVADHAPKDAPGSAHYPSPVSSSATGSAAAPAPAKELMAQPARQKENKTLESATATSHQAAAAPDPSPTFSSLSVTGAPTFAGFGEGDSNGSGAKKKLLIAAVIILALAAVGYFGFGFGKPGKSSAPPPAPVSAPQNSGQPAPAVAPISSPEAVPSPSPPGLASSPTQSSAPETEAAATLDKPSPSAGNPPATRIALDATPAAAKPASPPMVVKSNPVRATTQAQSEEAPALQGSPAAASVSDSNLRGLMSSAPSSVSKPSLATVKISQGVSQGLLIKRVQPKYPTSALAVHKEGAVQIEATINKEGNVNNLKVLSGDAVLARAALEAVRQWRYKPYYLNGEPVEIQTQITVNFKTN